MGFALRQGYPPMVACFCATALWSQERRCIRVEYETYVPPLSGGAVDTGLMAGSDGTAAICGTGKKAGIAKPSVTATISVCGTRNSSI